MSHEFTAYIQDSTMRTEPVQVVHASRYRQLEEAARAFILEAHDNVLAQDASCDHSVGICWCAYRHSLEALKDALGSEPPKSVHWVATSERLPPTGYAVLVSGDGWQNVAAHFGERSDVGWLSCQDGLELKRPTHWMLLPDAPIQPHKPGGDWPDVYGSCEKCGEIIVKEDAASHKCTSAGTEK